MKKQNQLIIAALFLGAVIAVVLTVTWASRAAHDLTGPTTLVQDELGQIWTQTGDVLHSLDSNGKRLSRRTTAELGLPNALGPISPLPGGEMLVGSRNPNLIYWVNVNSKVIRTLDPGKTQSRPLLNAYHIAFDKNVNALYVTDSSNQRVLLYDGEGRFVRGVGSDNFQPGIFHFPNQIKVIEDQIWIADTNHHEIAVLGKDLGAIRRIRVPNADDGTYRWPVMFDRDAAENLYVIQAGARLKKGQVVKYDAQGKQLMVFPISVDREPGAVLVLGDTLLISGRESFDIQQFTLNGQPLGSFGDAEFMEEMRTNHSRRENLVMLSTYAPLVLIAMLLLAYIGYVREVRQKSGSSVLAGLPIRERIELSGRAVVLILLTIMRRISPAVILLSLIAVLSRLPGAFAADRAANVLLGYGVMLVVYLHAVLLLEWVYLKMTRKGFFDPLIDASKQAFRVRYGALMERLLSSGETILELCNGQEGRMLWPQYYVLTSARLMVFDLDLLGTSVRRATEIPLAHLQDVHVHPIRFKFKRWLRGLPPVSEASFILNGQSQSLYFLTDSTAQKFMSALSSAPVGVDVQLHVGARQLNIGTITDPGDSGRVYRGNPSISASVVASILLPGMGQILQRRFLVGVIFLAFVGLWGLLAMTPVVTYYRKTAEIETVTVLQAIVPLAIWWLFSIWDAFSYARKFR